MQSAPQGWHRSVFASSTRGMASTVFIKDTGISYLLLSGLLLPLVWVAGQSPTYPIQVSDSAPSTTMTSASTTSGTLRPNMETTSSEANLQTSSSTMLIASTNSMSTTMTAGSTAATPTQNATMSTTYGGTEKSTAIPSSKSTSASIPQSTYFASSPSGGPTSISTNSASPTSGGSALSSTHYPSVTPEVSSSSSSHSALATSGSPAVQSTHFTSSTSGGSTLHSTSSASTSSSSSSTLSPSTTSGSLKPNSTHSTSSTSIGSSSSSNQSPTTSGGSTPHSTHSDTSTSRGSSSYTTQSPSTLSGGSALHNTHSSSSTSEGGMTAATGNTTSNSSMDMMYCPSFSCYYSDCYSMYNSQNASACATGESCQLLRSMDMWYNVSCSAACVESCTNTSQTNCSVKCCNSTGCLNDSFASMMMTTTVGATTTTQAPSTTTTLTPNKGNKCHKGSCTGETCYTDFKNQMLETCPSTLPHCQLKNEASGSGFAWKAGCSNCTVYTACSDSTKPPCNLECCTATTTSCLMLNGTRNLPSFATRGPYLQTELIASLLCILVISVLL